MITKSYFSPSLVYKVNRKHKFKEVSCSVTGTNYWPNFKVQVNPSGMNPNTL